MTETENRILTILKKHQPCTLADIVRHLCEGSQDSAKRHMEKLAASGLIVNQQRTGKSGRWTFAGVDIEALPGKPKPAAKPTPPTDNLAPGRLIGRMEGVYIPPRSFMRSDALDHQACMSLHAGVSRPYTGQPLALGVKSK